MYMNNNKNMETEMLVSRYLCGEASDQEQVQLLRWLKSDPANMAVFKRMKQTHDACLRLAANEEYDVQLAIKKFETIANQSRVKGKTIRMAILSAASVAAVVVAVLGFYLINNQDSTISFQQVATTTSQVKDVVLSDGTDITLNKSSNIAISSTFETKERLVKLDGEAFFAVTHDSQRPFIININQVQVKVLGTEFNVYSDTLRQMLTVTVKSGKVAVMVGAKSTIVSKGEYAKVNIISQTIESGENADSNYLAWKTGSLVFNDSPLYQVVETMNKHYGVKMCIDSTVNADCRLNATFDYKEIDKATELLSMALKVEIEKTSNTYLIRGRERKE